MHLNYPAGTLGAANQQGNAGNSGYGSFSLYYELIDGNNAKRKILGIKTFTYKAVGMI